MHFMFGLGYKFFHMTKKSITTLGSSTLLEIFYLVLPN